MRLDVLAILLLTGLFCVGLGWNVVQRARHEPGAVRRAHHADARACRECHATEHASWKLSGHAGVDCAACHGPAAEHVEHQRRPERRFSGAISGSRDTTIGSPRHLSPRDASELCGQCHAGAASALAASACQVPGEVSNDGRISCGVCHAMHLAMSDPRTPTEWSRGLLARRMRGDGSCLQCHADAHASAPRSDCVPCHAREPGAGAHAVRLTPAEATSR